VTRRSSIELAGLGLRSVAFRAQLAARGIACRTAICDGRLPYIYSQGDIRLGRHFALRSKVTRVEFGASHDAILTIGDGVFFNQGASVVASNSITIGDDCLIGDGVCIYDSNFHSVDGVAPVASAPVVLDRNVWLGRSSIVLPGVHIGENSVVAALSVVTKSVEPNTVVAGNPAVALSSFEHRTWKRH
jgi:acetyltransferase-like isoleucine patch superfamily enzyme